MANIIEINGIKNDRLASKVRHHEALISLANTLRRSEISSHEKLICEFIKSWTINGRKPKKALDIFLPIIVGDADLRSSIDAILETLSVPSQSLIIQTLEKTWPQDDAIIHRLKHLLQLKNSWIEQCPGMEFSQIVPPSAAYAFLENFEKR
jgi:hypothetical protein